MPGSSHPTVHWTPLGEGRASCDICPRACEIAEGKRGVCFVRANEGGEVVLTTYGRSTGFCVDPIEKKPLNHFLPGTPVLSFGTAGCNLLCKFCQNWETSRARDTDAAAAAASPEAIAAAALGLGCRSVAFTYNDPVIFHEYAIDVAVACRELGLRSVAVTAGYVNPEPRREFYANMDAANVDLKSFREKFYRDLTGSELAPVLDTLKYLRAETGVWLEITTLLIPGENDSEAEAAELAEWIALELGPDTPLHFSAFHPDFKLMGHPPTPPATLTRARAVARAAGLRHVFTGNVHDPEGGSSWCHSCGALLIERDWYTLGRWNLKAGACGSCGQPVAGVFDGEPGNWGARRLPVRLDADGEGAG